MTEVKQSPSSGISQRDKFALDPFLVFPVFSEWTRKISSWRLALIFPMIGGIVLLTCAIEGTLGSASDAQFWIDLRRIFSNRPADPSAAEFPLARDATSWFFLFVVGATCLLARRQWKLMKKCIPELVKSGALKKIERNSDFPVYPRYRWIHRRVLRLPQVLKRENSETSLEELNELVQWTNRKIEKIGRYGFSTAFAAFLLTLILILGVSRNGLFEVFGPYYDNAGWLAESYASWWASKNHPLGLAAYFSIIMLGIWVALLQNIVGVFCVYILLSFSAIVELDADWLNRDGRYGWKSIAQVYRNVVFSTALHGLTISVALVSLGFKNFPWMFGIVALWLVVIPLYIVVPNLIFYRVGVVARRRRIKKIEELFKGKAEESDIMGTRCFRDEIKEVHAAKINPLRIRPADLSAFAAAILPIVLTGVQVFVSVRYGSSGGK